ncbi:2-oxo-4-hydroxy-4-carboxy-5-ureidoimidazoline decarboxylase [Vibrio olivae]
MQAKYGQGKALSEKEQSQVKSASQEELEELLALNLAYQDKFGFIFIVCATNKSADEMLALLKERLPRSREAELKQAAIEQRKISRIRMEAYL